MDSEKSELQRKFDKYIHKVKKLESVSDKDKLYLYAHYKQATEGDNTRPKPSILKMVDSEKWRAWDALKGTSQETAIKNYVKKVKELYRDEV